MKEISKAKFNNYYKMMEVITVTKNQFIYHEGARADYFYLIYDGVFRLDKRIVYKNEKINDKKVKNDIVRYQTQIKLDRGDFTGGEAIFKLLLNDTQINKIIDDEHPKYNQSFIAESDFNIVIGINPKYFPADVRIKLYNYLKPIFDAKSEILKDMALKHEQSKSRMKISFRERLINDICKSEDKFYNIYY